MATPLPVHEPFHDKGALMGFLDDILKKKADAQTLPEKDAKPQAAQKLMEPEHIRGMPQTPVAGPAEKDDKRAGNDPDDLFDALTAIRNERGMDEKDTLMRTAEEAPAGQEKAPGDQTASKAPQAEQNDLLSKLDAFDAELAKMESEAVELKWQELHGKDVGQAFSELGNRNGQLVQRTNYPELVGNGILAESDPDVRRELELRFKQLMVSHVMSLPDVNELMAEVRREQFSFLVSMDGVQAYSPHEIEQILSASDDPFLRMKASMGKEQSIAMAGPKLLVVRFLNNASQMLMGRKSFAHLLLESQDTDLDGVSDLIMDFEERTRSSMRALEGAVCTSMGIKSLPHRDRAYFISRYFNAIDTNVLPKDPAFAMAKLRETFERMGFKKVHGGVYLDPAQLGTKPFTYSISGGEGYAEQECALRAAPGTFDYKVFINPEVSASGLEYLRTLLLESGRVAHYYGMDRLETRNIFKSDSECVKNAVAMLISSVASEEKWLRDVAGLPEHEARLLSGMMEYNNLVMARNLASDALFELGLYLGKEPGSHYRIVQELFHGSPIDYEVEKTWAWHPYLALKPGSQLTYIVGYLLYELIRQDMLMTYGTLLHPDVATHLVDNYFTGQKVPWAERFKSVAARHRVPEEERRVVIVESNGKGSKGLN